MSDGARTSAVRTAYMLGLHLEPSEMLPRPEKELRKRLWWAVYVLETKISIKLGRPFLLNESNITCSLPAADRDIAMLTSIEKAPLGKDVSWLSWNVEQIKLHIAARATYTAFYEKPPRPTSANKEMAASDQPDPLEIHAAALEKDMKRLDHWVDNVPGALKTARHNGVPYSTDTAALDFEIFAPLWIQRQRILLELNYHNMCTNLCRPLITFSPKQQPTPAADRGAARSAAHAITLTHMIHQVLLETQILTGWHEAFHWQWNAAVTLAGFALAYPHSELCSSARRALDHCIANCENFGLSMPIAANAVPIIHDLGRKVDMRISLYLGEVPDIPVTTFPDDMEISALLPALPDLEDADKIDFASKAFLNYQLAWPDIFLDTSNDGIEKEPVLLQFPDTSYPDPFPLSVSPDSGMPVLSV